MPRKLAKAITVETRPGQGIVKTKVVLHDGTKITHPGPIRLDAQY